MAATRRSAVLEFAILGLLQDAPMHGYELRKRLNAVMGSLRAISYGSLYPALKDLLDRGLIAEAGAADASAPVLSGRRAKIVYELTADGKDRFAELVSRTGPEAWEDEAFGVHMAFFGSTPAEVRVRILEGRRSRMEERRANLAASTARNRERLDTYTQALQRHGLRRLLSVILVVMLAGVLLGGGVWLVTAQVTSLAGEVPKYTENIKGKVKSLRHLGQGSVTSGLEKMIQDITGEWNLPAASEEGEDRDKPAVLALEKPTTVMVEPGRETNVRVEFPGQ